MRGRRAILAVLVVLAGCSGFSPGGDSSAATPTLTPAPVPNRGLEPIEGVWIDRVAAATVLENHRSALANVSYTLTTTLRVGPADNATFRKRTRTLVAAGSRPFLSNETILTTRPGLPGRETDVWWSGDRAVYRGHLRTGGYVFYVVEVKPVHRLRIHGGFGDLLRSFSVASVERGAGGSVVVAGYVTDTSAVQSTLNVWSVENVSMTMRIRPNGTIDRVAIGYDANYRGEQRAHLRYTAHITNVGSTTVRPPPWLRNFDDDGERSSDGG